MFTEDLDITPAEAVSRILVIAGAAAAAKPARDYGFEGQCDESGRRGYLITWHTRQAWFRRCRGLDYIAALIETPLRLWPVTELVQHVTGHTVAAAAGGDVVDDETRLQIGRRYREIESELADSMTTSEEADTLREERRRLAEYLANATGLCGSTRRVGDDVERLRGAVSHAIRRSITLVSRSIPGAGAHLRREIIGGRTYRYASTLLS